MICSLRFYFKHVSDNFDAQTALDILDHLSQTLSLRYTHYTCTVYFDDERSTGDASSFPANEAGKARLLNALEALRISERRDKFVCFFLAGISKENKNKAFFPRCEFVLTSGKMASQLSIDVPFDRRNPTMHRELYVQIIEYLAACGLIVNNSFCHTVSRWRQTQAFDSINVVVSPLDFQSPRTRLILHHAVRHSCKYRLDCSASIYWGNSISLSGLSPNVVQKVHQILGADCVRETAQSLIFVLSAFPRSFPTPLLRALQLRRLLKDHIA